VLVDPEADDKVAENIDAVKREAARPPPVNSARLPLPWKGRLGYVSLFSIYLHASLTAFKSKTQRSGK
jgi:UV DNA damage endonuclease